jgi:ELWxxDGT repeat protein
MFKSLITLFFACVFIQNTIAQTQTATLVKDIATSTIPYQNDEVSINTAVLQNEVFFSASIDAEYYLMAFDGTNKRTVFHTESTIDTFVVANNKVFFALNFQGKGWRIWASDGTTAGTIPVSDADTIPLFLIGNVNNKLLFGRGTRIYSTTGTLSSTAFVADIPNISAYKKVTVQGNKLFLAVSDGFTQSALWVTDATAAGTLNLANTTTAEAFNPDYWFLNSPNPTLIDWKGYWDSTTFYFSERTSSNMNLWQTDGTVAGTRRILQNASVRLMLRQGSNLLFVLQNNNLYLHNGTTLPTLVSDYTTQDRTTFVKTSTGVLLNLVPTNNPTAVATYRFDGANFVFFRTFATTGGADAFYGDYADFNGNTYFVCNAALWRTNGTANGTIKVKTGLINEDCGALDFVIRNNKLFFTVSNFQSSAPVRTLFVTNGTAATTFSLPVVLATTTLPKVREYIGAWTDNLYINTYFSDDIHNIHYTALWRTDGTVAGTLKLADTTILYNPATMPIAQSQYYSLGSNKYANMSVKGKGFFVYNIATTAATTQPALRLNAKLSAIINSFYTLNSTKTLFMASDYIDGQHPWVTDGTLNGTQVLSNISVHNVIGGWIGKINNIAYFYGFNNANMAQDGLWRTDGTPAGTYLLKAIVGIGKESVVLNNKLYFVGNTSALGSELWVTDGTTNGTQIVKDIAQGADDSRPRNLTLYNNKIYFTAETIINQRTLWQTDGTAAGTTLLKDLYPGSTYKDIYGTSVFNGLLYFRINDIFNGSVEALWRTDGTTNGTVLVKDFGVNTGHCVFYGNNNAIVNTTNAMYFKASTATNGCQMWASGGTAAGTQALANWGTGFQSYYSSDIQNWNDKILFHGLNGADYPYLATQNTITRLSAIPMNPNVSLFINGDKIYFDSDTKNPLGSEYCRAQNTTDSGVMIGDIFTGEYSSFPRYAFPLGNGKFVFTAESKENGREIWFSDNNSPPIFLADVQPGVGGADPRDFQLIGNDLIFTAFNENTGRELYKIANITSILPTFAVENASYPLYVFPNPTAANTSINLKNTNAAATATLYDITGKTLSAQNISTTDADFKLPDLAAGIYFLRCGQSVAKIIIQ